LERGLLRALFLTLMGLGIDKGKRRGIGSKGHES